MRTVEWNKLSDKEKHSYLTTEFSLSSLSIYSLTRAFEIALVLKLPLSIYQSPNGNIHTEIGANSEHCWGRITPVEAVWLALLKHRGIEVCERIINAEILAK